MTAESWVEAEHRIRLGMVGGEHGTFIGTVHRFAARLDGEFELVAGALSSDPDRALSLRRARHPCGPHVRLIHRDGGAGGEATGRH